MSKRYITGFLVMLLLLSLVIVGCGSKEETKPTEVKRIPVGVKTVTKGKMEKGIPLGGLLKPQEDVTLVSKNPSLRIQRVPAQVGDSVSVGTPLVIFDAREIDLLLRQAEDTYNDAKLNYERQQVLFEAGAIAKNMLEQSELAMVRAEINLENQRIMKENSLLTSPINGVVAAVSAVEGQLAGNMPLVSVVDIDKMELQVQVGEAHINKMKKGDIMEVNVPAASLYPFKGTITAIAPRVDAASKAYPVTLELDNSSKAMKGGMYGEVNLIVDRRESVIVIPQYAILDREQKKIVYVVEKELAKEKEVEVGLTLGRSAEIVKGLSEGEILIVEGQYGVKEGTPVTTTVRSE